MKKFFFFLGLCICIQWFSPVVSAQALADSISEGEAHKILNFLASGDLGGRGNFTPELTIAANFIANKFAEYGLQPLQGNFSFYQAFNAKDSRGIYRDKVKWNGKYLDPSQFVYLTPDVMPLSLALNDFNVVEYSGMFNDSILLAHWTDTTNTLILWKRASSDKKGIPLENIQTPNFPPLKNILFVSSVALPRSLVVTVNETYRDDVLFNIIGVLPGKTKPDEIIIFSAHYDHIGLTDGSINYGANDDASGTAAVLMLAKYFALRNDNDRTILFCAFAGEELGLVGSSFFASLVKPENIKSVINIEMIGKTNAAGKNSFIITGARYSSLEQILKTNLKNSVVQIHADPGKNNLFQRSDNFPFASKGIPAHTIMCSDDNDPCYHQRCDDVKGLDIENMVRVTRAIALSVQTIVSGDDTPSRISTRF
jgi:hypothetical protein